MLALQVKFCLRNIKHVSPLKIVLRLFTPSIRRRGPIKIPCFHSLIHKSAQLKTPFACGPDCIYRPVAELLDLNLASEKAFGFSTTCWLPTQCAFIVENIQTALAFGEVPGAVVIMGLGYGVGMLSQMKWLQTIEVVYWGDIDTHGFAILNRARAHLSHIRLIPTDG